MMMTRCAETDVYHQAFATFIEQHGKVYASEAERETHFAAFKASYLFVQAENSKGHSFKVGLNEMSDWTDKEMGNRRLSLRGPVSRRHSPPAKNRDITHIDDARTHGAKVIAMHGVTPGSD